ncbi:hypothetical protein [Bradyrhizobium genosp. P]|uniref:hypothetical protein n=1 Tax=Bradyrhizobium genosp. P TaxID=83641 RepID=UPI003CEE9C4D
MTTDIRSPRATKDVTRSLDGSANELGLMKLDELFDAQGLLSGDPFDAIARSLEQAILIVLRDFAQVLHQMSGRVRIVGELRARILYRLRRI